MKTLKWALCVALPGAAISLTMLASCQKSFRSNPTLNSEQTGIIGGSRVTQNDPIAKVIVWILTRGTDGKFGSCTGTIVSKDFILTAAHCFKENGVVNSEPQRIVLGSGIQASPRGVFLHPAYDDKKNFNRYDIALVQFQSESVLETAILPQAGSKPEVPGSYFVAGFGRVVADKPVDLPALYKLPSSIVIPELTSSEMVVYNSETTGTCYGDSGGPFYSVENGKVTLFSVLSRGAPGSGDCVGSDIQTMTESVLPWIQQTISGSDPSGVSAKK